MRPYLERQAATGLPGCGWARSGSRRSTRMCLPPLERAQHGSAVLFRFGKADRPDLGHAAELIRAEVVLTR